VPTLKPTTLTRRGWPWPGVASRWPQLNGLDVWETRANERRHETLLYQTIATHWPAFSERMEEHGGLPSFVRDEFEAYLQCGRLECGFLELECRQCGQSQLVALSCKKRAWCPSCLARRMSDTAAHLEQCVLPEVPVRHWICTFPWGVRAVLGYDQQLCARAESAFVSELSRSLRRRAKKLLGLASVTQTQTGAARAPGLKPSRASPTPSR